MTESTNASKGTEENEVPVLIRGSNMGIGIIPTITPKSEKSRIILDDGVDYVADPRIRAALVAQNTVDVQEFFQSIRS